MDSQAKLSKLAELAAHKVDYLFHLTHVRNLESILRDGLLPLSQLRSGQVAFTDVSEPTVQMRRDNKQLRLGPRVLSIHDLVPLFITPLTPMLYSRRNLIDELCFVIVHGSLICEDDVECVICDGNAASGPTKFWRLAPDQEVLSNLPWDVLRAQSWRDQPDGRRKRSAEVLVWPKVPVERIARIGVKSDGTRAGVDAALSAAGAKCECHVLPQIFF